MIHINGNKKENPNPKSMKNIQNMESKNDNTKLNSYSILSILPCKVRICNTYSKDEMKEYLYKSRETNNKNIKTPKSPISSKIPKKTVKTNLQVNAIEI